MDDHLQRALIEIYYAIAECRQSHATSADNCDLATRARLVATMANLEELVLILSGPLGRQRAA